MSAQTPEVSLIPASWCTSRWASRRTLVCGKHAEMSVWNWAVIGHQPVGVAQALPNQIVGGDKPSGAEVDIKINK